MWGVWGDPNSLNYHRLFLWSLQMWPPDSSPHTYWCVFGWLITCLPVGAALYFSLCLTFCLRCRLCSHLSLSRCPPNISASRLLSLSRCAFNSGSVILTSPHSPLARVSIVLGRLFALPSLNPNTLLLNCRLHLSPHAVLFSSRHFTVRPSAVSVRLLVVPGGPSEHQVFCQSDIGRFCASWGPTSPLHLWTRSVSPSSQCPCWLIRALESLHLYLVFRAVSNNYCNCRYFFHYILY